MLTELIEEHARPERGAQCRKPPRYRRKLSKPTNAVFFFNCDSKLESWMMGRWRGGSHVSAWFVTDWSAHNPIGRLTADYSWGV